ncbi:putative beta-glucosidase J [Colletotrichum trifolii]|uniref:beta-glucosidase n=1 Tax=Colletotrichum trifolii TaxID=5466 RepID=A0A4R8RXI1_COLTR|nr:putative beta-glucosidase J [Colletotrichum trifolii]
MQFTTVLSLTLLALGVSAQKTGPNGKRICVGGAISCQYQKGRCANICGDSFINGQGTPAFIDPNCSCPEGQSDNLYTGAAFMDALEATVRKLLVQLTLEEKVSLLTGSDTWHTQDIARLGIGAVKLTDGPSGARGKIFVDGTKSAFIPGADVPGGDVVEEPAEGAGPLAFRKAAAELGFDVSVKHARGAVTPKWLPLLEASQWSTAGLGAEDGALVRVDFFKNRDLAGPVEETQYCKSSSLDLIDSAPKAFQVDTVPPYSFRVTSVLTPASTGTHSFGISSIGDATVSVDDELVIDNRNWTETGETFYTFGSAEAVGKKHLEAGKAYRVRVEGGVRRERRPDHGTSPEVGHFAAHPSVRIGYQEELPDPEVLIQEAVDLADASEAAVVVLGLTVEWESEGYDRTTMALPPGQDALVEALLSRTKRPERLVFVNQSGSPVEVPWIDASTFLQAWYCGQEAGNAMADVLLGSVNPSGKLPVTWPKVYTDLPFGHDKEAWPGVDGVVKYKEDYQIGYRWYKHQQKKQPQWWFGDGLSYTTFEQEMLSISDDKDAWKVEVSVANTGNRKGAEVVQVYVWPAAEKEEAVLVGFEKTSVLTPQESARVTVEVKKKDAARWVEDGWLVASGEYVFGLSVGVRNEDGKTRKVFQEQLKWSTSE